MLGVIIYDALQRVPIYHSSHLTREFVDGVLDVVSADRSSQFSYVVGSPSLYRGHVRDSNDSDQQQQQSSSQQNDSTQKERISSALLHSSLLCGVVESHHKVHEETGLVRPPHWPRLVRAGGTSLGRAAVAPNCPTPSRAQVNLSTTHLTTRQISNSRALNEGCVTLSANNSQQYVWLQTSSSGGSGGSGASAAVTASSVVTEEAVKWTLSFEKKHQQQEEEFRKERMEAMKKGFEKFYSSSQNQSQMMMSGNNNNNATTPEQQEIQAALEKAASREEQEELIRELMQRKEEEVLKSKKLAKIASQHIPAVYHFPWRIFGETLGISYVIYSDVPPNSVFEKNVVLSKNENVNNNSGAGNNYNNNDNSSSSSSSSVNSEKTKQQQQHEENLQAAKQSMSNLFVLLCEAFKTVKSAEAPTSKQLLLSLDLVHEVVEIVCPGNGRCLPLFDTAMARKIWKVRSDS